MNMSQSTNTPKHIGFIVDGNRRWARERGLSTMEGHTRGYEQLKEVGLDLLDRGVETVSAYVFSTENWKRAESEVSYLMNLLMKVATRDLDEIIEKNVRIRFVGTTDNLSDKVIKTIRKCEEKSAHCTKGTLALCFNYGGRAEIADACKQIAEEGIPPEQITPEVVQQHLYQPDIPDVDLTVRTSGEQRLSNFMLWRAAYSELMFIDKYWPDMTKQDASGIIDEYSRRKRRFGA